MQSSRNIQIEKSNLSWGKILSDEYFPLDVEFRDETNVHGSLRSWSLGEIDISILECDAVLYRRHENHDLNGNDRSLLVTIPLENAVNFKQATRETECEPGAFLIERSDAPYEFWHSMKNKLWVVKIPISSVHARMGATDRLGALTFDASSGVASYFLGALKNTINCVGGMSNVPRRLAGQHIIDMLCIAIKSDDRILDSDGSSTQAAHLQRAVQFIHDNLADPNLNSRLVADACGISLRYLQRLFTENSLSVTGYIRENRVVRCHEELKIMGKKVMIAELALKWGFFDQAQFCKYYRNRYGCTPTDTRKQAQANLIMMN